MKGDNGVSEANEVTLPLEPRSGSILIAVGFNPRNAYPIDEAENLPRMDSALGVLLDGFAVKEMRKPPKIFFAE